MSKELSILGVRVDKLNKQEVREKIVSMLAGSQQNLICTPNPEIILAAQKNEEFNKILNNSQLNVPDGAGLLWAAKRLGEKIPERITGVDLMQEICKLPQISNHQVFLLGASPGIAEIAAINLQKQNDQLQIAGCFSGSPQASDTEKILELINQSSADVLFVAFGAPAQEIWLAKHLPHLPNIKIAMGVGGAFDFISGAKKRAPLWLRKLWLEWLYRLLKEPSRLGRIYNATIKFPYSIIKKR